MGYDKMLFKITPPAITGRSANVGLMLGRRRRRWPNINPALI